MYEVIKMHIQASRSNFKQECQERHSQPSGTFLSRGAVLLNMSLCLWAILQENYREEYELHLFSDGTLTPELMAVNPESIPSRAKVETITHSLSA